MKILVCGGRDYDKWRRVWDCLDVLNGLHGITSVVTGACCDDSGEACGADRWAETWARRHRMKYAGDPANWERDGLAGGPIRNQRMFDEEQPDIVLAMPGGSGTAGMRKIAKAGGLKQRYATAHDGTAVFYRDTVPVVKPVDKRTFSVARL